MKTTSAIVHDLHYPCVTILYSFDGKQNDAKWMTQKSDTIIEYIRKVLTDKYSATKAHSIIEKVQKALSNINCNTAKTGVALFIAPLYSKVIYLDIPVEDKIVIDEPFEIRDLIYITSSLPQYLVLLICAKHFRIFKGNSHHLTALKTLIPNHIEAYENDIAERVANFSDVSERKEVMLDKFLHHVDNELTRILKEYPLPVILIGAKRTAGHFKEFSHNNENIVEYIHGSYDEATISELKELLNPHFFSLQKNRVTNIETKLKEAMNTHKLVWGIHEAWRCAMKKNIQLLVVENNFHYPSNQEGPLVNLPEVSMDGVDPSYLLDAVDVIIEKVLESGGKVEFVPKGILNGQESIALIQYY